MGGNHIVFLGGSIPKRQWQFCISGIVTATLSELFEKQDPGSIEPENRSRWDNILDILKAVRVEEKAKKNMTMHGSYLDGETFDRYHDFLLEESYIAGSNPEQGIYVLTEKGEVLLNRLNEMERKLG